MAASPSQVYDAAFDALLRSPAQTQGAGTAVPESASVGSPAAAEAMRALFGGRDAPYSPPSSESPAPPMRAFIATPAPAERITQLGAQLAAMMEAMQAMMEEIKRLAAEPEPQAAAATTAPPDPLQQPGMDAWLKYAQVHGPGAPMPTGLSGPWVGTSAAPLQPIHPKDVSKPEKYGGNTDDWLQWSKSFKQFLDGKDRRWEPLLDEVEKSG